jgi:FkbM family methyltransferase
MPRIQDNDLEDDIAALITARLPKARLDLVFDVGANIGWVSWQFVRNLPHVRVHAFEPVPGTFADLQANLSRFPGTDRVTMVQMALGAETGQARMTNHPGRTTNRIVTTRDEPTVEVEVQRGDDYCASHGFDRIDYLKIDVEGHDLEVLQGFVGMMKRGAINFISVEVGFSGEIPVHRPLGDFDAFLRPFGFRLMVIKNQATSEIPYLQYADAVFIREDYAREIQ